MGAEEQGYQASRELIFYHLHEYVKRKDLRGGRRIFFAFIHDGLESISVLGDHLIRLFAACGSLSDANHVFHSISRPTIFSWNSIIAAHVNNGEGERALVLYRKLQDLGFQPEKVTLLSALKACRSIHSATSGRFLHEQIVLLNMDTDPLIGNSLVDMYSNCGSLHEAYAVFIRLSTCNVVSWTIIIAAFAQCSCYMFAFRLYDQMLQEGVKPNKFTFMAVLQACISGRSIKQGMMIHNQIMRSGLVIDPELGSSVINVYSKCGNLQESRKVFDGLPKHDVVSWGAVISGHAQNGDGLNAIRLFKSMQEEGFKADKFIYSSILRACAIEKATELGRVIHNELLASKLHLHVVVGTALVDMHIEFGDLDTAQKLFDELPEANEISWGKLIKGYVQHGRAFSALQLFEKMQNVLVRANKTVNIFALKACGQVRLSVQGRLIHDQIMRFESEIDTFTESSLIEFYAHSGQLVEAEFMFCKSQNHDVRIWGALLEGYLQHDFVDSILQLFQYMQMEAVQFDVFTYECVLKACNSMSDLRLIHDNIIRHNFEKDLIICNTLISSYSSNGSIEEALQVFQKSQYIDVSSWTALMGGLISCSHYSIAFNVFEEMQQSGIQPSEVTFLCLLKVCIIAKDAQKGRLAHDRIVRSGLRCQGALANALIDVYGSCGYVYEALDVFGGLECPDEVSWGTMIAVYSQHEHDILALKLVQTMQRKGVTLSAAILLCALKACGKLGAVVWGKLMHYVVINTGFESDLAVISTLIYMYAECGYILEAHKLFYALPTQDLALWSTLLAHCGNMDQARELFVHMQQQGIDPNAQIFTNIIAACAREGLLEEGQCYYKAMREGHRLDPNLWQCTSVANLLGRTGNMKEAYDVLCAMPMLPDQAIWRALLSGCKLHEDVVLGQHSFDQAVNGACGCAIIENSELGCTESPEKQNSVTQQQYNIEFLTTELQ